MTLYAICDTCDARADANKLSPRGWRQGWDYEAATMRHECPKCTGAVVSKKETTRKRRVKTKSAETRGGLFE